MSLQLEKYRFRISDSIVLIGFFKIFINFYNNDMYKGLDIMQIKNNIFLFLTYKDKILENFQDFISKTCKASNPKKCYGYTN